ncbi:hypothetical protein [Pasteurella atlantica]|uniref:hypothetical protein n=1 Tax=Pasteurellaceae TaxID=712 RepID=UPI002761595C|nr:hypothetical protein [Pasteurella atlantica]MDP8098819.1 hypothetical protein [Pasteurella atlantica]MDP8106262.1 hypothetical protein [Pasteurella atlantica]MDP8115991.1 hypothetical protein [Pasteurella atlantica]
MKNLRDKGNALKIQKYQLNSAEDKLSEIDLILRDLKKEQSDNDQSLDSMINDMNVLLSRVDISNISREILEIEQQKIENELNTVKSNNVTFISYLDQIEMNDKTSWEEYQKLFENYACKNNINLQQAPFKDLMTKSQQIELQKRIKEEFSYKNAKCDKYDYMIAGTCGVLTGLIDIFFIGAPEDSKLGNVTDKFANNMTKKFAELLGWDRAKAVEQGANTTASAIAFLEGNGAKGRKIAKNKESGLTTQILKKLGYINDDNNFSGFKINYDQATTKSTGGKVNNLSLKNHHLKSLGHSPDIIGLFFSILNQFTNTSSFISNGKIITIETEEFELQGHNFIAKIFCGFANWFGHIMSDWTGSSGTVGQGGRGTGVPIPFYNLFQLLDFGAFGKHKQTFATITTKVFEQGYDLRHGMAMAIPVVINELLIRFMYTMKARFYHKKEWKDCLPNGNIPEVRRMLLVGHGTLCLLDGTDAYLRSGGEMVQFLLRSNLIAWVRFGHLGLKEVSAFAKSGHIDAELVDQYLEQEYAKLCYYK